MFELSGSNQGKSGNLEIFDGFFPIFLGCKYIFENNSDFHFQRSNKNNFPELSPPQVYFLEKLGNLSN